MNPRASDRVRGFQDTTIVVGDTRFTVIVGATLGAELVIILKFQYTGKEFTYLVL